MLGWTGVVQAAQVSVQLVNPDVTADIRVFLDHKLVYDGAPSPAPSNSEGTLSVTVATIEAVGGQPHVLTAVAPGTRVKAQLQWIPQHASDGWVVIRYYPGRRNPEELPFFTFSLQSSASMKK